MNTEELFAKTFRLFDLGYSKKLHKSLNAVIRLHKSDEYSTCIECTRAISPSVSWPCQTIKSIEKELQ